jgi:RhtB (resistance to homoserine/threonine) family protein
MTGVINFETFLLAGILLNLTPGNDTVFILTKSIGQGKKAGVISALGIGTGNIVHTTIAALGLSIIIAKSVILFNVIKYAGAAYLIYMGIKMLLDRSGLNTTDTSSSSQSNYLKIFRDGIVTNVLNPKVSLFFLAFLPQFIDPAATNTVIPFLILGFTFVTTGTIWCLILATFSSVIFAGLKNNGRMSLFVNRICGLTLVGLGVKVALTKR